MPKKQKKLMTEDAYAFYCKALRLLNESGIPFLLAGAFALREYTGISRDTKDLDVFCREEHYPAILSFFEAKGYRIEITDARWLAKVWQGKYFVDVIWSTASNIYQVDDSWFDNATRSEALGEKVLLLGAEEMAYSKLYIRNRERYDGADLNHLFLRHGKKMNWEKLTDRLGAHWPLLLEQFIEFLFIYPSDREQLPQELLMQLMDKIKTIYELPVPETKVCRGPLMDHTQYAADVEQWGYKTVTIYTI